MAMGWGSTLMQNEATFMSLDGAMMLISCGSLTAFHPAVFFPFMSKKKEAPTAGSEEFMMAPTQGTNGPNDTKSSSPYTST